MRRRAVKIPSLAALLTTFVVGCGGQTTTTPQASPRDEAAASQPDGPADASVAEAPPEPEEPPPPPAPPPREHGTSGLLASVPPLVWRSADAVEDEWYRLKRLDSDLEGQYRELAATKLRRTACRGLVDVRTADPDRAPFGYRDDVRQRSWARPTLARLLVEALASLRKEYPDAYVTLGDLAQPGCGQLEHGTLVRLLSDDDLPTVSRPGEPPPIEPVGAATAMINQARLVAGVPTVYELKQARDLRGESWRLSFVNEPVLLEHRVLAQGQTTPDEGEPKLLLKVETRRYRPLEPPDADKVDELRRVLQRVTGDGTVVREERVHHWDPVEGDQVLWLQHFVDAGRRRQAIVVATERIRGGRVHVSELRDVRLAQWQRRKPGSLPEELRWVVDTRSPEGPARFQRWQKLYEAGHITHLAGRDADISYVTVGNKHHFGVALDLIDVPATWRWFEILHETAKRLGVEVDRIIVAPSVKRLLRRKLPRKVRRSREWRSIRLVRGHDAHHHLRIAPASKKIEVGCMKALEEEVAARPPVFAGN